MTRAIRMYLSLYKCFLKELRKLLMLKRIRNLLLLISKTKEIVKAIIKTIKGITKTKMEIIKAIIKTIKDLRVEGKEVGDQEEEETFKINKWT